MDRFFDDSFERLLREKTDEFRMYPSRRVWSSLYNNLHPGSYWPSRAVSIALLSLLLVIGHLNSNQSSKNVRSARVASAPHLSTNTFAAFPTTENANPLSQKSPKTDPFAPFVGSVPSISEQFTTEKNLPSFAVNTAAPKRRLRQRNAFNPTTSFAQQNGNTISFNNKRSPSAAEQSLPTDRQLVQSISREVITHNVENSNADLRLPESLRPYTTTSKNSEGSTPADFDTDVVEQLDKRQAAIETDDDAKASSITNSAPIPTSNKAVFRIALLSSKASSNNGIAIASSNKLDRLRFSRPGYMPNESELSYMEQHELAKTRRRGFTQKLSWTAWGSPSLVYRNLFYSPLPPASQFSAVVSPQPLSPEIDRSVKQHASWGFEAGLGVKLELIRRVRVTAGFQANYTRYNVEAFENAHPVATTLTMNNKSTGTHYEVLRATKYSNGFGMDAVTLHNQTLQVSLPIGLEYRLIGRQRLQWYIGTSIQPTFLVNGKAYLISTDRRNYVEESGMLRRWNLNAGLETYISYTGKNGIIWNVGPQFRRQLFSTNRSQYAVEEFLNGYGVRIGITKPIR